MSCDMNCGGQVSDLTTPNQIRCGGAYIYTTIYRNELFQNTIATPQIQTTNTLALCNTTAPNALLLFDEKVFKYIGCYAAIDEATAENDSIYKDPSGDMKYFCEQEAIIRGAKYFGAALDGSHCYFASNLTNLKLRVDSNDCYSLPPIAYKNSIIQSVGGYNYIQSVYETNFNLPPAPGTTDPLYATKVPLITSLCNSSL